MLVADDQALVRHGFALILASDPDIEVIAEVPDGVQALARSRDVRPDVVLMDIQMPEMDGIEATRHLTSSPHTTGVRVLMLTTFGTDEHVYQALLAGASGFLLKDTAPEELIGAVKTVAAGDALLAPALTRRLIERYVLPAKSPATQSVSARTLKLPELTQRESDTLRAVARGLSNAEIAAEMHVGYSTVKTHVSHLLTKLDVRDRAQLVMIAYQSGLAGPR